MCFLKEYIEKIFMMHFEERNGMSSLEDAIRLQQKLAKQFSYLDKISEVTRLQSSAYFQTVDVARNLGGALQPLINALDRKSVV